MHKLERRVFSLVASLTAAVLLATGGSVASQSTNETEAQEQEPQSQTQEQAPEESPSTAPARRSVPHVTGTVARWTGNRIDLKTSAGKSQKVAVNRDTEQLVEIKEGTEVTVEYHRIISGFIIAERVLPAREDAPAAQPGTGTAQGQNASAVTGSVVSWNNAALLLRTEAGEITLFLSPSTEYLVKSLDPGLLVTVEYREGSNGARLATRVLAAKAKDEDSTKKDSGSSE